MNRAEENTDDEIHITFDLSVSAQKAFEVFVSRLNRWWPAAYTWSGQMLDYIAIEPSENGRCFERGPHNFECDWGRVLVWNPPERLVFTWQIAPNRVPEPNPNKASEVEILFAKNEPGNTEVHFTHRNFEKHGADGAGYRQALSAPEGWPYILDQYKDAVKLTTS